MSYILEALKKSQQERELGRVPTLDTAVLFEEDKTDPRRGPWGPLALGLAAIALLIALYAALRVPPPPAPALTERPATPAEPAPPPRTLPEPRRASGQPDAVSATPAAPLVEAPPPKSARPLPPAALPAAAGPKPAAEPGGGTEAELDAQIQRELERQLAEDTVATDRAAQAVPEEAPADPAPTPIPPDLLADIESFKRQLKGGEDPRAAPAPRAATARKSADPTTLRLTPEQQAGLPSYSMPVHVYVSDKAQRFVLIDGLKYREGEETAQGLKVEQILPDGTVLSFRGNPFYVHR